MIQETSWGPVTIYDGKSTGPGSWYKPRGPLSSWGLLAYGANSTTAVVQAGKVEGTLSDATTPVAAEVFTLSTATVAAGYKTATGKPARQVRWNATAAPASTSSTSATVVVKVCGTL